ncbi:MAG: hypothetical protein AB7E05_04990 [Sphingobium sp.]
MQGTITGLARIGMITAGLLMLGACIMSPGKFTSTLDIRADRSFTFAYKGEVIVNDFSDMSKGLGDSDSGDEGDEDGDLPADEGQNTAYYQQIALTGQDDAAPMPTEQTPPAAPEPEDAEKLAKMNEIAAALSKEEGYRSVQYMGQNRFEIDYRIDGRLDHSFVFPFNIDAQAAFPFVAIEVRKDGRVRVQAPGFAEKNESAAAVGSMGKGKNAAQHEGSFTLTTNAEIVSQNQEDGAVSTPQGKQIVWKITPTTSIAPMAVLKLAPLR